MPEKEVIIIGAGLAGLSAGIYAQMNGYRSHIFEHHTQPGGVAAAWKKEDYLIDGGIHFIMGYKPGTAIHKVYQDLGIIPFNRFVDMITYGRFLDEKSGYSISVTQDLKRLSEDLKRISPVDAQLIDELMAGARLMQGIDASEMGMMNPPELSSPLGGVKEIWKMRRFLRCFAGKYAQSIADYSQAVQHPYLRDFISTLFLPDVPIWFIFMLLGLLADGQIGYLEGGCLDFVWSMEKRYRELGGEVTYNATVEKILVKNDCAVGICLADNSEYRADAVISACDGYSTIFDMLEGKYINEKIKKRYDSWKLTRPLVMISYGIEREFADEPTFSIVKLENPLLVKYEIIDHIFIRIFNYSSKFAPQGKTVIQVEFESEWDFWNNLRNEDVFAYDKQKERIAEEVLKRLEVHYPDISLYLEVVDVATPHTLWRCTRNQKGAWGGWLLTKELMSAKIERTLPNLKNFYMAGQWVMPGGVPTSLYSGRHAIQILCHQDKKSFSTEK